MPLEMMFYILSEVKLRLNKTTTIQVFAHSIFSKKKYIGSTDSNWSK